MAAHLLRAATSGAAYHDLVISFPAGREILQRHVANTLAEVAIDYGASSPGTQPASGVEVQENAVMGQGVPYSVSTPQACFHGTFVRLVTPGAEHGVRLRPRGDTRFLTAWRG